MRISHLAAALAAIALIAIGGCKKAGTDAAPKTAFVKIGTGSQTGVYYPTGQNIGKMVMDKKDTYGINVDVQSTAGSLYNVNAILSKDLDFGVVQSDVQYQAYKGMGDDWQEKGPQTQLRAVFAIHPEIVTIVAADDAGINTVADLKGKKINLGPPGSARVNAVQALRAAGLDPDADVDDQGISVAQAPEYLKDGKIDAFFYTVGHPNGNILQATAGGVNTRKVHFVPITDVDDLLAKNPYFAKANIPISFYEGVSNTADVPSFAVKATLLTRADVPDDVVYAITKEVFENLDAFKKLHQAYNGLTRENMLEGLSAPLHPGAIRYYKEVGLMD